MKTYSTILLAILIGVAAMAFWRKKSKETPPPVTEQEFAEMQKSFARAYAVELLFAERPELDSDAIFASMQKYCGNVKMAEQKDDSKVLLFFHLDHTVTYSDGEVPAQSVIAFPNEDDGTQEDSLALQQSWRWPEAREAVSNSTASLCQLECCRSTTRD